MGCGHVFVEKREPRREFLDHGGTVAREHEVDSRFHGLFRFRGSQERGDVNESGALIEVYVNDCTSC